MAKRKGIIKEALDFGKEKAITEEKYCTNSPKSCADDRVVEICNKVYPPETKEEQNLYCKCAKDKQLYPFLYESEIKEKQKGLGTMECRHAKRLTRKRRKRSKESEE